MATVGTTNHLPNPRRTAQLVETIVDEVLSHPITEKRFAKEVAAVSSKLESSSPSEADVLGWTRGMAVPSVHGRLLPETVLNGLAIRFAAQYRKEVEKCLANVEMPLRIVRTSLKNEGPAAFQVVLDKLAAHARVTDRLWSGQILENGPVVTFMVPLVALVAKPIIEAQSELQSMLSLSRHPDIEICRNAVQTMVTEFVLTTTLGPMRRKD